MPVSTCIIKSDWGPLAFTNNELANLGFEWLTPRGFRESLVVLLISIRASTTILTTYSKKVLLPRWSCGNLCTTQSMGSTLFLVSTVLTISARATPHWSVKNKKKGWLSLLVPLLVGTMFTRGLQGYRPTPKVGLQQSNCLVTFQCIADEKGTIFLMRTNCPRFSFTAARPQGTWRSERTSYLHGPMFGGTWSPPWVYL